MVGGWSPRLLWDSRVTATAPVFLPGGSHGQRSLVATVHGVTDESDRTEPLKKKTQAKIPLFHSTILLILQFSHSIISDSLRPHRLQYTRLPCPSRTPGACTNSCPLSW